MFVSVRWICGSMMCFCLLYLVVVSVLCVDGGVRAIGSWKVVHVGRWSVIGGEIVPAVVVVAVRVVSVISISEEVRWTWS